MKPATAKAKGRETENLLVGWLRARGVPAERRRLAGAADRGDIAGFAGPAGECVVEVKSGARLDLAGWTEELRREQFNAGAATGIVAVRPKGRPDPADWWAVLPMPAALELLRRAGFTP